MGGVKRDGLSNVVSPQVLLRVTSSGFFALLLSLRVDGFDRSCGDDGWLGQHFSIRKRESLSATAPEVELNDRELRLFMVAPKTKHESPAKGTEVTHMHKKGALKRGTNGGY